MASLSRPQSSAHAPSPPSAYSSPAPLTYANSGNASHLDPTAASESECLNSGKGKERHSSSVKIEKNPRKNTSGSYSASNHGTTSLETDRSSGDLSSPAPDWMYSLGCTQQQEIDLAAAGMGCSSTVMLGNIANSTKGGSTSPISYLRLQPHYEPNDILQCAPLNSNEESIASYHQCLSSDHSPPPSSLVFKTSTGVPPPSQLQPPTCSSQNILHLYGHGCGGSDLLGSASPNGQLLPRSASISMSQSPERVNGTLRNCIFAANSATHPRRIRVDGKGYNVLSFDGGGCRGYASLLTLRNILRRRVPAPTPVFPYLHFDLICGTSTGGLIAILLAVLHLDIDSAIRVYEVFGKAVFGTHWSKLRYVLQDERCNSKLLKKAVSEILRTHGEGRTLLEDPNYDRGCKCFVTVAHRNHDKVQVLLVRSYPPPRGTDNIPNGHQWTILDAAMATAAATTFFRPHRITTEGYTFHFEDAGAHGANNPTLKAWKELNSDCFPNIGGPNCFVSIGTGTKGIPKDSPVNSNHKGARRILNNLMNINVRREALTKGLVNRATDVDEVHYIMEELTRITTETETLYHRFNPPQVGRIPLTDYQAVPTIQHTMLNYHTESNTNAQLDKCSQNIDIVAIPPS